MNYYVVTLSKLLIRENLFESVSIRLEGMKYKYHNNHGSNSNHAQDLM